MLKINVNVNSFNKNVFSVLLRSCVKNAIKLFFQFARQFYIAQWFRDTTKEAEKKHNQTNDEDFVAEDEEKITEEATDIEARTKFLLEQVEINLKPYSSFK